MKKVIKKMKEVTIVEAKTNFNSLLKEAQAGHILITRHGQPAGVILGFEDDEDFFDWRLEHDPVLIAKIEKMFARRDRRGNKSFDEVMNDLGFTREELGMEEEESEEKPEPALATADS